MKSHLQDLENNEAILLMYLADELPRADRLEVDQMLASDAALRTELEILRQTQQLAYDSLETLDAVTRQAAPPIISLGRVTRLIHDWVEQRRRPANVIVAVHRPMPWRRISVSIAAAALIGYYIWAVYQPPPKHHTFPDNPLVTDEDPDLISSPPSRELSSLEKVALLANSLDDSASDEASNLHVAEVAAASPVDSADQNVTGEP